MVSRCIQFPNPIRSPAVQSHLNALLCSERSGPECTGIGGDCSEVVPVCIKAHYFINDT